MKNNNIGRIEYIDIFRSLGIIFMVMGHVGFTAYFDHFIHAFHMPMFFFVSGFFFKGKSKEEFSFADFLKKKARGLLVPYLCFGILHYVIYVIAYGFSAEPLFHLIWINTDKLPIAGALWFLTALFFAELIYFSLDRYIKNKYAKVVAIALLGIFGCLANLLPFTLPFGISASLASLPVYFAGNLIKAHQQDKAVDKLLNMPLLFFIPLTLVTIVLIFVNGYINMRTGSYGFILLFYINVLLSVAVLMNFSKYMFKIFGNKFPNSILFGIGKNSLVYLSLNQLFILLFRFIANNTILISGGIGIILSKLFILISTMVVLCLCELLFKRTKLKFMLGK